MAARTVFHWRLECSLVLALACSSPQREVTQAQHAPTPLVAATPSDAPVVASQINAAAPLAETHFELVHAGDCASNYQLEDLGTRTLVVSPKTVRFLDVGQGWADPPDRSGGLPRDRGPASLWSRAPLLLSVAKRPPASDMQGSSKSDQYFRFAEDGWVPIAQDFGEIPIALPVATGTVMVGWFDERVQHRGDPEIVPAGNLTRARLIALDGTVSELSSWPLVMTWQQQSSPHTLWAVAAKPRHKGQFLLRVPLDGAASFHAIPGVSRCSGIDRLTQLATLDAVTDDSAELTIADAPECVVKKLAGHYRFQGGKFSRTGDAEPPDSTPFAQRMAEATVTARDREFRLVADRVEVTRSVTGDSNSVEGTAVEQSALLGIAPGPDPVSHYMQVTAGGHEAWVSSRAGERCFIHRYRWP